jgi:hypothetical protein
VRCTPTWYAGVSQCQYGNGQQDSFHEAVLFSHNTFRCVLLTDIREGREHHTEDLLLFRFMAQYAVNSTIFTPKQSIPCRV